MLYIDPIPAPSGAYPNPKKQPFKGCIQLTDDQAEVLRQYNGFVAITSHEEGYEEGFFRTVYEVTPNTEAWEAWKAALPPEPEPDAPLDQRVADLETSNAELYEALDMILTGVTE